MSALCHHDKCQHCVTMINTRRLNHRSFLVFVIAMSGVGTFLLIAQRSMQYDNNIATTAKGASVPMVTTSFRRVTKSLAEMRYGIQIPELSDHVLFFNRVPKTGSEMLVLLLQWLQGINSFRHIRLGGGSARKLNSMQQEELVEEVTKKIRDEAVPVTFDRHVYFVNFSRFDRQSPAYINLVRDPIDKAASRFYYMRATPNPQNPDLQNAPTFKPKKSGSESFDHCVQSGDPECTYMTGRDYDLTIPYFCGQEQWCTILNDYRSLERAKANVERYFPAVGILEELNATLAVLENRHPYFFHGLQKIYFQDLMEPHHNRNRKRPHHITHATRKYLEKVLQTEYEFYYWLRARLLRQYSKLTLQ